MYNWHGKLDCNNLHGIHRQQLEQARKDLELYVASSPEMAELQSARPSF